MIVQYTCSRTGKVDRLQTNMRLQMVFHARRVLAITGGRRAETAKLLGISRDTLYRLLK